MKNKFMLLLTLTITASISFASSIKKYEKNELEVTNFLFELCPSEATKLLTQSYTKISAAEYKSSLTPGGIVHTTYEFTFVQNSPAPSFKESKWVLIAEEFVRPNLSMAPDAPGVIVDVTCSVSAVVD